MVSVNTHDQVLALDPNTSDLPAFRALQVENQKIKEVIEEAWDQAGLPTFLRYLREYIDQRLHEEQPNLSRHRHGSPVRFLIRGTRARHRSLITDEGSVRFSNTPACGDTLSAHPGPTRLPVGKTLHL